jgi:hypothetical protein
MPAQLRRGLVDDERGAPPADQAREENQAEAISGPERGPLDLRGEDHESLAWEDGLGDQRGLRPGQIADGVPGARPGRRPGPGEELAVGRASRCPGASPDRRPGGRAHTPPPPPTAEHSATARAQAGSPTASRRGQGAASNMDDHGSHDNGPVFARVAAAAHGISGAATERGVRAVPRRRPAGVPRPYPGAGRDPLAARAPGVCAVLQLPSPAPGPGPGDPGCTPGRRNPASAGWRRAGHPHPAGAPPRLRASSVTPGAGLLGHDRCLAVRLRMASWWRSGAFSRGSADRLCVASAAAPR